MKLQFAFTMTRRQKVATSVWCGIGSALFIAPQALLPFAEVSAETVAAGIGAPAAIAVVFWLAKSLADDHDRKAKQHESARQGQAMVNQAEHALARIRKPAHLRPSQVLEGEVLPR